jgi:hypothetical protein
LGTRAPTGGAINPPTGFPIMPDIRWMTYSELSEALGIGGDSARNLVRRKHWPRKPGNDGLARIGVPVEHLSEHAKPEGAISPPSDGSINPPVSTPIEPPIDGGIVQTLNRHIERLEREIEILKGERDAECARALPVDALRAALEIERQRVEEWKAVADRWALQAERLSEQRRSWWPWRRSA